MDKGVFMVLMRCLALVSDLASRKCFRHTEAGGVTISPEQDRELVDFFLQNPVTSSKERYKFIRVEYPFATGSCVQRTGYNQRLAGHPPEIVRPEITERCISLMPGGQ